MRSGLGTRSPYSTCCRVMRFQFLGRLHPSSPVSSERRACTTAQAAAHTVHRCISRPCAKPLGSASQKAAVHRVLACIRSTYAKPPECASQESKSKQWRAFWKDSWKVRPMAMASPTLFIWVVSSALAPGNFSKANRGICAPDLQH